MRVLLYEHVFISLGPLGASLGPELRGHVGTLLTFGGTAKLFSKVAAFPLVTCEGVRFSASSPTLVIVHPFESCRPSECELIVHCGFD